MAWCDRGHRYDESLGQCALCATLASGDRVRGVATPTVNEEAAGGMPFGKRGPPPPPRPPAPPQGVSSRIRGTQFDEDEERLARLMGFLVVVASREDEENTYVRLQKGVNWIGRFGSRATVELRDRECSERHAILICTDRAARLIDLDSTNGTFVNRDRVDIVSLQEGDRISVGRTELVFVPFTFLAED